MTEDNHDKGGGGSFGAFIGDDGVFHHPIVRGERDGGGYSFEEVRRKLGLAAPYIRQLKEGAGERTEEARKQGARSINDDLGGGQQARPRDIDKVAEGCAFIKGTLDTGGANLVGEPIWHDLTAVAHYCVDPEGTVARLIEKSPHYNFDHAMLKLNEVRKARESSDTLGFPRCLTLESNGAKPFCDACKYQQYAKSPLNTPEANEHTKPGEPASEAVRDANYGLVPEVVDAAGVYQPIPGGWYDASDENIERLNSRFCLVNEGPDTLWWENKGPDGWIERPEKDLQRGLGNVFVRMKADDGDGTKRRGRPFLFLWFHEHKGRGAPLAAVFKPNQPRLPAPGEFNMWQGWGVEPDFDFYDVDENGKRTPKPQLVMMLRHLSDTLCSSDAQDFTYAVKWHGWVFQNWDKPAHTIPIYKDDNRGTGKSLWCEWLVRMGGAHAQIFINKEHLPGKHAVHEYLCLAILDDIIVERDHKAQDAIKSLATSATRVVEPKGRALRRVVNRVTLSVTSNHKAPLLAGVNERRQFVPKVSDKHAQDKAYFDPLRHAADNGGVEMLLGFFLKLSLKEWTPHQVHKTSELARLQLDCMKEFDRWMWDCAESEDLLGCYVLKRVSQVAAPGNPSAGAGGAGRELASEQAINTGVAEHAPLDRHFEVNAIRDAFRRHTGVRSGQMTNRATGDALMRLDLQRKQCTNDSVGGRYPKWGYFIPDGAELKRRILDANRIKEYVER
jgi:hypothetical protein